MSENENMTERENPGTMPGSPTINPEITPQYEGTIAIPFNPGDFGVELKTNWQLIIPQIDSTIYTEKGQKGHNKFTRKGRDLANRNWNTMLDAIDNKTNLETIKKASNSVFEKLSENSDAHSNYLNQLKKSFEARITYMENIKLWAEIQASNSPWNETFEVIKDTVYPGLPLEMIKNFTAGRLRRVRNQIAEKVDKSINNGEIEKEERDYKITELETRTANYMTKYLKANYEKILREKGSTRSEASVIEESVAESEKTPQENVAVETEFEENIADLTADDLEVEENGKVSAGIMTAAREKITHKFKRFKRKIKEALPRPDERRRFLAKVFIVVTTLATAAGLTKMVIDVGSSDAREIDANYFPSPTPITEKVSPVIEAASVLKEDERGIYVTSSVLGGKEKPSESPIKPKDEVIETPDPTGTPAPTETSTLTPEATATQSPTQEKPFVFGGIDFSNESKVSMNIDLGNNQFNIIFTPITFQDNFTPEEAEEFLNRFEPGSDTAGIFTDRNGNTLLMCHSGYSGNEALECEDIRIFLEGGSKDPKDRMLTEEQRQENMQSLVDQIVPLEQDGVVKKFVISAVGYVPNSLKDEFEKDSKGALDVLIESTGKESSPFSIYRGGERRAVLLTFCGWGPRNEADWWVWSRYVVALEPVEQVQKYENTGNATETSKIQ